MKENNISQVLHGNDIYGSGLSRHSPDAIWRSFTKSSTRSILVLVFSVLLIVGAFACTHLLDPIVILGNFSSKAAATTQLYDSFPRGPHKPQKKVEIPVNCPAYNQTGTCPPDYPISFQPDDYSNRPSTTPTCPDYFRWIHEDLRPWARSGITKDMVERARQTANFKLVILNGKAYLETFEKAFQTRDVFTLWGILQLLRRYPGKLPDLELMFDCVDWPVVQSEHYSGSNATGPPPLFRYCGNDATLDIVFPDWSYWGWAEVNIKPWETVVGEMKEGNKRIGWINREPYAYWKGNPTVAETRQDLMKCDVTQGQEWNARVYAQDWGRESQEGYKHSDLANQCTHRYKIYIEGSAWSVSEKYILACNSVTLMVTPHYYDFFTRGLIPLYHYWPVKEYDKCRSIKYAVDWGNSHQQKAQAMGKAASDFIQEELKMDYVYDYMFHLLNSYAKLFRYKPTKSEAAKELCVEAMVCKAEGNEKKFMMESMVESPANTNPCTMPPPYDPPSLHANLRRKETTIQQIDFWEKQQGLQP